MIVGGSSEMGRRTAADVVCAGGCAVIIGQDASKVDDTIQALAKDGSAHSITADLTDRTQVDRVCEQLADEHADATLLVNAAGFFIPEAFVDDAASYDAHLELDRATFFLIQTVVRRHDRARPRWRDRQHRQHVGGLGHRSHPVVGLLGGKGGLHALTHNLAIELGPHKIRVNAVAPAMVATDLRAVRPQRQARRDPAQLRRLPSAWPCRHRTRPGQHHHVPPFTGHQLCHRRHMECRRRRDSRPQLKALARLRAGSTVARRPTHAVHCGPAVPAIQTRGDER